MKKKKRKKEKKKKKEKEKSGKEEEYITCSGERQPRALFLFGIPFLVSNQRQ